MGYISVLADFSSRYLFSYIYTAIPTVNKSILKIAVPAILSNVIVPLLGLVDLTIAGHIGDAVTIGAVSVGATMFSLSDWNFGFLRMGTSGLTAQAYGARDRRQMSVMLFRSVALALLLGIAIVALQSPIRWLLLAAISPSEAVHTHASQYFSIIIWGAPATLATMSLTGWFIGMQNSTYPLAVSMVVNVVNIVCSLCFVFAMRLGFIGIPLGTLAAQWCGFILSAFFAARMMRKETLGYAPRVEEMLRGLGRFFSVNRDIFLRSLCVMAVMLFFTATGARSGNMTLAVNALFMQLYLLYSHFMDGFAYAGEALVGKYAGAADKHSLRRCVSHLFAWGWSLAAIFAFAYGVFNHEVMSLFSDNEVVAFAAAYRWWIALAPIAGMAAFIWDGVFVGLTATRQMLLSLAGATAVYFAIYFLSPFPDANSSLWTAFLTYLAVRGVILWLCFARKNEY